MATEIKAPQASLSPRTAMPDLGPALAALTASSAPEVPFGLDPQQVGALLSAGNGQNDDLIKAIQLMADHQYKTGMLQEQRRQTDINQGQLELSRFKIENEVNMQQAEMRLREKLNEAQISHTKAQTSAAYAQADQARAGAAANRASAAMASKQAQLVQMKLDGLNSLKQNSITLPSGDQIDLGTLASTDVISHLPQLVQLDQYGEITKPQLVKMQGFINEIMEKGELEISPGIKLGRDASFMALKDTALFGTLVASATAEAGKVVTPDKIYTMVSDGFSKLQLPTEQTVRGILDLGIALARTAQLRAVDKTTRDQLDFTEEELVRMTIERFPHLKNKISVGRRVNDGRTFNNPGTMEESDEAEDSPTSAPVKKPTKYEDMLNRYLPK